MAYASPDDKQRHNRVYAQRYRPRRLVVRRAWRAQNRAAFNLARKMQITIASARQILGEMSCQ